MLNLAALKHVRSEKDPFILMRMVEVNILNTNKTIQQTRENGTHKYFCVSTDKAANPVNMMGASKRIMELFLMYCLLRLTYNKKANCMYQNYSNNTTNNQIIN